MKMRARAFIRLVRRARGASRWNERAFGREDFVSRRASAVRVRGRVCVEWWRTMRRGGDATSTRFGDRVSD